MQNPHKKSIPKHSLRFFTPAKTPGAGRLLYTIQYPVLTRYSQTGTLLTGRCLLIMLEQLWKPEMYDMLAVKGYHVEAV